jgi:hypothetical protein
MVGDGMDTCHVRAVEKEVLRSRVRKGNLHPVQNTKQSEGRRPNPTAKAKVKEKTTADETLPNKSTDNKMVSSCTNDNDPRSSTTVL